LKKLLKRVLVHFTDNSFHRINLTKRQLTENSVGRTPFDRKFNSPKGHLIEKKIEKGLIETTFDKNVITEKKLDRGHLTEILSGRKAI
jgi:hypothetical protein